MESHGIENLLSQNKRPPKRPFLYNPNKQHKKEVKTKKDNKALSDLEAHL